MSGRTGNIEDELGILLYSGTYEFSYRTRDLTSFTTSLPAAAAKFTVPAGVGLQPASTIQETRLGLASGATTNSPNVSFALACTVPGVDVSVTCGFEFRVDDEVEWRVAQGSRITIEEVDATETCVVEACKQASFLGSEPCRANQNVVLGDGPHRIEVRASTTTLSSTRVSSRRALPVFRWTLDTTPPSAGWRRAVWMGASSLGTPTGHRPHTVSDGFQQPVADLRRGQPHGLTARRLAGSGVESGIVYIRCVDSAGNPSRPEMKAPQTPRDPAGSCFRRRRLPHGSRRAPHPLEPTSAVGADRSDPSAGVQCGSARQKASGEPPALAPGAKRPLVWKWSNAASKATWTVIGEYKLWVRGTDLTGVDSASVSHAGTCAAAGERLLQSGRRVHPAPSRSRSW